MNIIHLRTRRIANSSHRHYVAFIRKALPPQQQQQQDDDDGIAVEKKKEEETAWTLFNDEKVVQAGDDVQEMMKTAYVYFFERV